MKIFKLTTDKGSALLYFGDDYITKLNVEQRQAFEQLLADKERLVNALKILMGAYRNRGGGILDTDYKIAQTAINTAIAQQPKPEITISYVKRVCPNCKVEAVISDGYCGICRQCTLPPITK